NGRSGRPSSVCGLRPMIMSGQVRAASLAACYTQLVYPRRVLRQLRTRTPGVELVPLRPALLACSSGLSDLGIVARYAGIEARFSIVGRRAAAPDRLDGVPFV